jgi:hypothetical protein
MGIHSGQHVLQHDQVVAFGSIESFCHLRVGRGNRSGESSVQRVEVTTARRHRIAPSRSVWNAPFCIFGSRHYPLYSAAKYPSRLDVAIDHSITESSADTTASTSTSAETAPEAAWRPSPEYDANRLVPGRK